MAKSFVECDKTFLNNRNWFQIYFGPFMCGLHDDWGAPDIEFESEGDMHGDLDYLYAVVANPDGACGKHGIGNETISIMAFRIGWDEPYSAAIRDENLVFAGTPEEWVAEYGE